MQMQWNYSIHKMHLAHRHLLQLEDILQQMALAIVGCQNSDSVGGVAEQTHVLVCGAHIFGLAQILVEVGRRSGLACECKGALVHTCEFLKKGLSKGTTRCLHSR